MKGSNSPVKMALFARSHFERFKILPVKMTLFARNRFEGFKIIPVKMAILERSPREEDPFCAQPL